MKAVVLMLSLLAAPAVVKDMNHCADVSSPDCAVRDYWPLYAGDPTGVEAYYLINMNNEVCFVTNQQYSRAIIGHLFDCPGPWRTRRSV